MDILSDDVLSVAIAVVPEWGWVDRTGGQSELNGRNCRGVASPREP